MTDKRLGNRAIFPTLTAAFHAMLAAQLPAPTQHHRSGYPGRHRPAGAKIARRAREGTLGINHRDGIIGTTFRLGAKMSHARKLRQAGKPLEPWQTKMLDGQML